MDAQTVRFICLILAVVITGWIAIRLLRCKQRHEHQKFLKREKQSTNSFLEDCGISEDFKSKIALAIRETLADLGNVPVELIHSNDKFEIELRYLKFCDNFYVQDLADSLKRKIGLELSPQQMSQIPNPDVPPSGLTVREFVHKILLVMKT